MEPAESAKWFICEENWDHRLFISFIYYGLMFLHVMFIYFTAKYIEGNNINRPKLHAQQQNN